MTKQPRAPHPPSRAAIIIVLLALLPLLAASAAAQGDYLIGAKDVLTIAVWEQADLTGKFTVESDGAFTFPLIGRIKAGGLTVRQFEDELKKRLTGGRFLKNPQVTVSVDQYGSQHVYVGGEVRQPGAIVLTGEMTLVEALARAGSTTPAASSEAIVTRAGAGKPSGAPMLPVDGTAPGGIRVDLRRLQEGNLEQNLQLKDGDSVFVPKAEMIYVTGQVRTPGAYPLQTKDTTVMQALALAGGLTDRGASNRIQIVRVVNGKEKKISVKLSDKVLPGDTVIVPERWI